jgi:hypothetical protein
VLAAEQARFRPEQQPLLDEAWNGVSTLMRIGRKERCNYSRLSAPSTEVIAGASEEGTEAGLALAVVVVSTRSGR